MPETTVERFTSRERVCIFIDNTNLLHAVRTLAEKGQRIDYYFLKEYLGQGRPVDARFYYSKVALLGMEGQRQVEKQQRFLSSIEELGYSMIGVDSAGSTKEGGLELEIAYDMVKLSYQQALAPYTSFILVANDDVYARVVRRLRVDTGMEIDVAFFGLPRCCTLLSRAASHYHDLSKISDRLFRHRRFPSSSPVLA